MSFNFKSFTANNPLLQEIEEEVTVSSSGIEMGQSSQDKFPRVEFEDAVRKALQAGVDKDTLHKIIDWS